jgi:hypothetical protein
VRYCGKVHDGVGTLHERASVEFSGDVRNLDRLRFGMYRSLPACIPNGGADGVPAREQVATKHRAHESGCTGD